MVKIYGLRAPFPFIKGHVRHLRPIWLMEEMEAPYTAQLLDMQKGEEESESYLTINPFGRVPSIQDGAFTMYESAAICTYLAEKFNSKLIPTVKTQQRAFHDQWMCVAITMIEPHTTRVFVVDHFYKDAPEGLILRNAAIEALEPFLKVVDEHLAKNKYLTGDVFTVADILMSTSLRLIAHSELLEKHRNLQDYLNRNTERPAFLKAVTLQ